MTRPVPALSSIHASSHREDHAFRWLRGRQREGMVVTDRRGMLKASLAGIAGLSTANLLSVRSSLAAAGKPAAGAKSVILLWMAGGPSHIDMWDPKPDRPFENRGPFGVTSTKVPGVIICEHLPKQAAMMDKLTIIRSVDAKGSNHEPNKVFQTGSRLAAPRSNPEGPMYPAIGSIVAKHRGANSPGMPPYVAFMKSRSHIGFAGYLGQQYDPFIAEQAARLPIYTNVGEDTGKMSGGDLFSLPRGLHHERLMERRELLRSFDKFDAAMDRSGAMDAVDQYGRQAIDMVAGERARLAFDITREPQEVRDRYGKHLWCQQALLARRLVEAGVAFVTIDLSYHPASGTWDNHGDNIPPYGGISKGLKPLLPLFDHLHTTLIQDLEERGLLDDVLVIAMGEFGRTPQIGTQGSTDGRNHWPEVMSMVLAGGGLRHGRVVGSTERDGGQIKENPFTPADLAATIYRHMGVPLDAHYLDNRGRPRHILEENGTPLT
jgi:hypothetical protein